MVDDILAGLKKVDFNMVYNVALGVAASKLVVVCLKWLLAAVAAQLPA